MTTSLTEFLEGERKEFENLKTELLAMIEDGTIKIGALGLSEGSANFLHDFSLSAHDSRLIAHLREMVKGFEKAEGHEHLFSHRTGVCKCTYNGALDDILSLLPPSTDTL